MFSIAVRIKFGWLISCLLPLLTDLTRFEVLISEDKSFFICL